MKRGTKPTDYFPSATTGPIRFPDLIAARAAVRKVRSLNLDEMSVDDLKHLVEPIIKGIILHLPILDPGLKLFRARRGPRNQNIRDALYPPADVAPLGRANREGCPMFYCCDLMEGPYFEIPLEPGDVLTLTHWVTTEHILPNMVGYSETTFRRLKSNRSVKTSVKLPPTPMARQISTELIDFLSDLFTRPPASVKNLNEYKLSVAIAELLYDHDGFDGLLYPTAAMRANCDNLALKPRFVDSGLRFERAEFMKINAIEQGPHGPVLNINRLDQASALGSSGEILWKGHSSDRWTLGPGAALVASVENGRYVMRDLQGKVIAPD